MVNRMNKILLNILGFIVGVIWLNIAAQYFYFRFDLTKEKKFTLHPATREIVRDINKSITITVYLDGELPSAFRRLKNATADLLNDYAADAGNNIHYQFVNPIAGRSGIALDSTINNLYRVGIEPTSLNIKNENGFAQKIIFPVAMVEGNGQSYPIKLLQNLDAAGDYEENINNSIQNLEYLFTSAIQKILTQNHPRIGFTEGNDELTNQQLSDAITTLSDSYEVGRVNLDVINKSGLDKLNMLVITKPQKEFTEVQKYKINYFVMRGGSVLWSIDQVGAELDSMGKSGEQLAFNRKLNLDDMLFMYGARVNYNLIADANCAEIPLSTGGVQGQIQMAPWIYYPLLMPDTSSSLVKNIDGIRSEFVSTVDTIGVRGLKKSTLLKTSGFNKVHNTPKLLSLQMVAEQPDPREFASIPQTVGVLIEGSFPSVFLNRSVPAGISENFPVPAQSKPGKMIVLGDGDLFKNQVSSRDGSSFPLGFDRYSQRTFGNKTLLLNLVDYLSNDHNLIALRNKEVKIRLLDKAKLRNDKLTWQLLNVGLPLAMLILFAIFQHYYRSRKYAR
ncbi:MAG: gliding motility-associated ABC transporter substrate-binding protein GldG [Pedobacter sp.]|nr:gliding motility-associated ABC transporter substrate-binding protein GldG [Pedobacter sp.]